MAKRFLPHLQSPLPLDAQITHCVSFLFCYCEKEEGRSMLEIEGDNEKYQIQKRNNSPREFPPMIYSLMPQPNSLLKVLVTTLPVLLPALRSLTCWGGGDKD